jgi:hypothetical protein
MLVLFICMLCDVGTSGFLAKGNHAAASSTSSKPGKQSAMTRAFPPDGWDPAASLCFSGSPAAPPCRDPRRRPQGQPEQVTGHACARVTPTATTGRGQGGRGSAAQVWAAQHARFRPSSVPRLFAGRLSPGQARQRRFSPGLRGLAAGIGAMRAGESALIENFRAMYRTRSPASSSYQVSQRL